jgi:predicted lipid-binding transport protein (Tim44 family)
MGRAACAGWADGHTVRFTAPTCSSSPANEVTTMMQALLQQFAGSSGAADVITSLTGQGLSRDEAEKAVSATAEGAAAQFGGDGVAGLLGGLMGGGGGGAMGMLGGLMGGGAAASSGGLPPEVLAGIARFVADKTGLSPDKAQLAVSVVVPRVIAFIKDKT